MTENTKKDSVTIPKKVLLGIAPAIAIIAILLSKNKTPEVLLFGVGIFCGVLIGINWVKGQK